MSDTVVRVENLSKKYRIGSKEHRHMGYYSLRESVMDLLKAPFRNFARLKRLTRFDDNRQESDVFYALKDVSFDVKQGEVVGIIGRNGAGKSTLLKILSRITEPSSGRAVLEGRVGSLLEVGTGFHPELTGRENVFLSGAVLGMKKKEIETKFDEIVAFSEIEKFLETPVKRYSSGMYVRLAFGVAAHLEPEILLVDEVLAVGDAKFQKRCLGKMEDVSKQGRTVFFISHNMGMISALCQRSLLLDNGIVTMDGTATEAIHQYYTDGTGSPYRVDYEQIGRIVGDHLATLSAACIEDLEGRCVGEIDIRHSFKIKMTYIQHEDVAQAPFANFHFYDARGQCVFVTGDRNPLCRKEGKYEAICLVPGNLLNNDTYFVDLALTFMHSGVHVSFNQKAALSIVVRDPIDETLDEMRGGYSGAIPGAVRPQLKWEVNQIS